MCQNIRQLLLSGLVVSACFIMSSCYLSKLGYQHIKYMSKRQPISEIILEESADRGTLAKLKTVQDTLLFAAKIGFSSKDAYIYHVDTHSPVVSYIVQAAPADRLELKTWWFPITGSVPYLGFFELSECKSEAESLSSNGYDVNISGVGAYSSLGWFSDPIFSPMLNRNPEFLSELLLHELTHRTVWLSGSAEFNEQLADFVATKAVKKFLEDRGQSLQWQNIEQQHQDKKIFRKWLQDLKGALERLYATSVRESWPREQLLKEKQATFDGFLATEKRPQFKIADFIGRRQNWNNATVMGSALYNENSEVFEAAYACMPEPKLNAFLKELKALAKNSPDNPQKALQQLCK